MESFRKAYGALKDSTKVGLAKVNSDFKDLDIAIVKATNHVECPPKERYVRKIFTAVSIARPRADVAYCIHALNKRLAKTRNWIVALKILIVFHRTLREADPSFREELLHYSQSGRFFQVSGFRDGSTSLAWDCSAWIRSYGLFLEERLECFQTLNSDIESDKASKSSFGDSKPSNKTQHWTTEEMLNKLPALQQLLYRLVGCQPERTASRNFLIQYALALVLKESFKIYRAINDGIVNLLETFFEMPKLDAVKALEIYKRAGQQAELLADFYGFCKTLDLARTFQFPTLTQPPPSFLSTMEDYVREAPQTPSLSTNKWQDSQDREEIEDPAPRQAAAQTVKEEIKDEVEPAEENKIPPPVDLLDLSEPSPNAEPLDQANALALAIIQPDDHASMWSSTMSTDKTTGWELALVTAPSNMTSTQATQSKMGGGFDELLLDSLYGDDAARRKIQMHGAGYSTNQGYNHPIIQPQFNQPMMNSPTTFYPQHMMQMTVMSPQEQQMMFHQQQQQMMYHQQRQLQPFSMMATQPPQQNLYTVQHHYQQQMPHAGSSNPFGDHFHYSQNGNGNQSLL